MKAQVISDFTDKYTKVRHLKGETYEGTEERVKELEKRNLVERVKEKVVTKISKKKY